MTTESKCPVMGGAQKQMATGPRGNRDWWPNQLNLKMLHANSPQADPMGEKFNYADEFKTLDLDAVKKDIAAVMTEARRHAELFT